MNDKLDLIKKTDTIYCVLPDQQKAEVERCYKCGKLIVGAVILKGRVMLPCREKDCPHEEFNVEFGTTTYRNKTDKVFMRRLKPC